VFVGMVSIARQSSHFSERTTAEDTQFHVMKLMVWFVMQVK
jgi:hypothetical protein